MSTTTSGSTGSTRRQRAENETMTLIMVGETHAMIRGDSGKSHPIQTDGVDATACACKDYTYNTNRCKHMIAYEEWLIDSVETSH